LPALQAKLATCTLTVPLFSCFDVTSLVILPRRLCKSLSSRAPNFSTLPRIARHPQAVSAPHLKDSNIMRNTTNLICQAGLLWSLCFHGLTNCFSRKPFVFREICVAPGGVPMMFPNPALGCACDLLGSMFSAACGLFCAFRALFAHSCLCFQSLTDSFAKYRGWGRSARTRAQGGTRG